MLTTHIAMPYTRRVHHKLKHNDYQRLEIRRMLNADPGIYEVDQDPSVGAVVTALIVNDPEDPTDSYDILTGWKSAVDELVGVGIEEVTFAIYRQVQVGGLIGGASNSTVQAAVEYANANNLSVTLLPLFEANGWRGNYDPSGQVRNRFQTEYKQWISDLARIPGVDRFNIGSELNQMVGNPDNFDFFVDLIETAHESFDAAGNQTGQIGYAANFDAYNDPQHIALLTHPGIEFMGVSAYRSVIANSNYQLVAGLDTVSSSVFQQMVNNWNTELNALSSFASANQLPLLIQEFGAVQQNYAAVAPFAVDPGDFVDDSAADLFAPDPLEQQALYESLIVAMNGRGNEFESVVFWTWEHQASRGRRTFEQLGTTGVIEKFAIWPTDGGGGEFLAQFVATKIGEFDPDVVDGQLTIRGTASNDEIYLFENESIFTTQINGVSESFSRSLFDSVLVLSGDGDDFVKRFGSTNLVVVQDGGNGNDLLIGGESSDVLLGGNGNDRLFGLGGVDELFGNDGDDYIHGGEGNNRAYGGSGNDELIGLSGNDYQHGGMGNDKLHGLQGQDELHGGPGSDLIYGGTDNDVLNGESDNDRIFGGDGNDLLVGQNGDDELYGGNGIDQIYGLNGNDEIFGMEGNDNLQGGLGDDLLFGGPGNDNLNAHQGDDRLFGDAGSDTINGHAGNDIAVGGAGNDFVFGGSGNDFLLGGLGFDTVRGLAGDDLVIGMHSTIEQQLPRLESIFSVWLSNASYIERVNELRTGDGQVPNQIGDENLLPLVLVDDNQLDTIFGDSELDYFWGEADELQHKTADEILDEL